MVTGHFKGIKGKGDMDDVEDEDSGAGAVNFITVDLGLGSV